jgi:KamA family protein
MTPDARVYHRKFKAYTQRNLEQIPQLRHMGPEQIEAMKAVSSVFPFRVNDYVLDELIDWNNIPEDPMFQLTFPQPGMLESSDLEALISMVHAGATQGELSAAARPIQDRLNPHPAGQMEMNVPRMGGHPFAGAQHKYRETVLFFPSQGQTCHTYCTYCFRWAQFVGIDELKFASREAEKLERYITQHKEVSDVLFTGGDPLVMRTKTLERYIEPLLDIDHLACIRIGTKATAYWPQRFLSDKDADDLMRLFERVRAAGKHLAVMSHYSHARELETPAAQAALRRIQDTGAIVRCQAPLIRHVNDSASVWADMWRLQVRLGAVPYYMFVERDTGPKGYFEVPLLKAYEIYRKARRRISGLGRTARGPSMSATPGKVVIDGVTEVAGEEVFMLRFIQARDPDWVSRPFFAKLDPKACWLDELVPAGGESEFFFQRAMQRISESGRAPAWGSRDVLQKDPTIFGHVEWE